MASILSLSLSLVSSSPLLSSFLLLCFLPLFLSSSCSPTAMADLQNPYLLPYPCNIDSTLSTHNIWRALSTLWDALLPFALLWWNIMLSATCAKYYSWRRMIHVSPCSSHGLCFANSHPPCFSVSDQIVADSQLLGGISTNSSFSYSDDSGDDVDNHDDDEGSKLGLFDHISYNHDDNDGEAIVTKLGWLYCHSHQLYGEDSSLSVSEVKSSSTQGKYSDEDEDEDEKPLRTCSESSTSQSLAANLKIEENFRPSVNLNGGDGFSIRSELNSTRNMLSSLCVSSSEGKSSYTTSTDISCLLPSIVSCTKLSYLSLQNKEQASFGSAVCVQETTAPIHPDFCNEDHALSKDYAGQNSRVQIGRPLLHYNKSRPTVGYNLWRVRGKFLPRLCYVKESSQVIEILNDQTLTRVHNKQISFPAAKSTMKFRPIYLDEAKAWLSIVKNIAVNCTDLAHFPALEHELSLGLEVNFPPKKVAPHMYNVQDEDEDASISTSYLNGGELESFSLSQADQIIDSDVAAAKEEDNVSNGGHFTSEDNGLYVAFNEFYSAYVGGGVSYKTHNGNDFNDDADSSHSSQDDDYVADNITSYAEEPHNHNDVSFHNGDILHYNPKNDKFDGNANHYKASATWWDEDAIFIAEGEGGDDTMDQAWLIV